MFSGEFQGINTMSLLGPNIRVIEDVAYLNGIEDDVD